jgi:5,10-methylenetetrahydromethanopterin reductase
MKFSLRMNNDVDAKAFARIADLAEASGFDQLWVSNDLFLESAAVLVAAAAQATEKIELGVGVFNPVSMHTPEIAMIAASLHELSNGRFNLGLGAGADRFLGWAGLVPRPPVARTRKAIHELRALFAGTTPPAFASEARLANAPLDVRIYVGAMGTRMLQLAGELADGALPLLFPPSHFAVAHQTITDGAWRAGRDPDELDIAACVWCSIADDAAAARRAMAAKLAYYGPSFAPELLQRASLTPEDFTTVENVTPAMLSLGIAGSPDDVIEACGKLIEAGARHVSFGPPLGPEPEAAVRTLGRRVLPALGRPR